MKIHSTWPLLFLTPTTNLSLPCTMNNKQQMSQTQCLEASKSCLILSQPIDKAAPFTPSLGYTTFFCSKLNCRFFKQDRINLRISLLSYLFYAWSDSFSKTDSQVHLFVNTRVRCSVGFSFNLVWPICPFIP